MKRVSFPSLIHLLSRHTSNRLLIVKFLSHKSDAVSSISQAKNPAFQRCSEARCEAPSFGGKNERRIPAIANAISARAGTFCLSHWCSRGPDITSRKRIFTFGKFAPTLFSADPRRGSKVAVSVPTISDTREIHDNPQEFVNNLLITAGRSRARGQRLRGRANCPISLRPNFKFFYHLAHFIEFRVGRHDRVGQSAQTSSQRTRAPSLIRHGDDDEFRSHCPA
jgi:hypothetical protein